MIAAPAASAFSLAPPTPAAELKPLSADRYSLKLTISATVHRNLLAAQALLRHRIMRPAADQWIRAGGPYGGRPAGQSVSPRAA